LDLTMLFPEVLIFINQFLDHWTSIWHIEGSFYISSRSSNRLVYKVWIDYPLLENLDIDPLAISSLYPKEKELE
jgi:hypothetical protein